MGESYDMLRAVGNGLILWSAAVGIASVIVHARVPWWRTQMGRHLMAYMTVIAAVLTLSSVRVFTGDTWWFAVLRVVVFFGVPLAMTQRLWLQIKAQRDDARQEKHPRPVPPPAPRKDPNDDPV